MSKHHQNLLSNLLRFYPLLSTTSKFVSDDRVVHGGHVRCCCFASSDLVEVNIRNPLHVLFVQVVLVDGAKK